MPRQLKSEQIKLFHETTVGSQWISGRPETADPLSGTPDFLPGEVIPDEVRVGELTVRRYSAELWTSAQRKASSIHEISYRACFKPQLAAFFIERFSEEGDLVYDPFGGRGTTVIEAGLLGRKVVQNDINPLSALLTKPRFFVPAKEAVRDRLSLVPRDYGQAPQLDLSMFYHPATEKEILALREFLTGRRGPGGMMMKSMHGSGWWQQTGSPGIPVVSFRYTPSPQTRQYPRVPRQRSTSSGSRFHHTGIPMKSS